MTIGSNAAIIENKAFYNTPLFCNSFLYSLTLALGTFIITFFPVSAHAQQETVLLDSFVLLIVSVLNFPFFPANSFPSLVVFEGRIKLLIGLSKKI